MGLVWGEYLSIGNGLIDSDHKNLIVVINSIEQAIGTKDRAALSKYFELLDFYMGIHFRNEEKVAAAIKFHFAKNKLEHLQLMHEMRIMLKMLEDKHIAWPNNTMQTYSSFLAGWMTDHIIKTDMQMKSALQSYPYDFIPC
jgi:hemerythrin-like metal-binding protein